MGTWSDELIERTKSEAYPGTMMKSLDWNFGMMSKRDSGGIKIVGLKKEYNFPVPSDEVIAEFANIDEMIKAGWVID